MGDEGGSRRSYLFTLDYDGRWHSSSIPDRPCTYARDILSKNRKSVHESQEINRTTWIWSGGWNSFETPLMGCFTYVAVQGKESVCVVTGDNHANKRKYGKWMEEVVTTIRNHNVFGYNKREMRRYVRDLGEDEDLRPFAAVSVILGPKEVGESGYEVSFSLKVGAQSNVNRSIGVIWSTVLNQVSSVGLHEKEAIDILMKKMENDSSAFTPEETIQTAFSALECLLNMGELEPNMIKACVHTKIGGNWDKRRLKIDEIKEHLNVFYKHRCK